MRSGPEPGRLLAPFFFLAWAGPALGQDALRLSFPIDCALGETCHIQQYVDRAPSAARLDHGCGTLANDGHKGTDFALPSVAAMRSGVPVLAAAPGIVRGLRDGMPDIDAAAPGAPETTGRECGNGVVLRHADGWETQYCHLRQGSLSVAMGQRVEAGTAMGLVGMSGLATFPHLHFAVRRNHAVIDPFLPDMTVDCDGTMRSGLWAEPISYRPGGLAAAGVLDRVPDFAEVKAGLPPVALPETAPAALVLWGYLFGGQVGDRVEIALAEPGTAPRRQSFILAKSQPLLYRAWGIRAPDRGFQEGNYVGTLRHLRGDVELDSRTLAFTLPAG